MIFKEESSQMSFTQTLRKNQLILFLRAFQFTSFQTLPQIYYIHASFYKGEHYAAYVPLRFYLQNFDSLTPVKSSYSDGKYSHDYRLNGKYALDIYRGLKSSSNTEYVKALHQLIVSVYDDGHTAMTPPKVNSIEA